MDKKLFNILACPICKSEVFLSSVSDLTFVELVAEEKQEITEKKPQKSEKCKLPTEEEFLVCKACQLAYPVRDDIPVMLESDAWQIKKSEYKSR